MALLNSKLLNYVYRMYNPQTGKVFAEIKPIVVKKLPMYKIDHDNLKEKESHDKLIQLVDGMLELHRRMDGTKTPHEQDSVKRQIEAVDHQIDVLVYELYGLTDEEKTLVEDSLSK